MPAVTVTAPDGTQYHVNAPEGATDDQIMEYVQKQVKASHEASEPSFLDSLHGAASSALDGALPGAGGALSGLAGALMHPSDMRKGFTDARRASERHEEQFKQDHPYLGAAATGAGFVGGMFLPATELGLAERGAAAVARAAPSIGRRVLNSAINGGLMGAAGGALDSHADGIGGVVQDTARGAFMGGAVAGALPFAGRLTAPLVSVPAMAAARHLAPAVGRAGRALPGRFGEALRSHAANMAMDPAEARASRYIGNKLDDAGMDGPALMAELQRRHALGVPAAPADVSETLRAAYGSAARRPGPATMAVRRAIDDRQREMTSRVQDHIGETLGDVTNVEAQAAALRQAGKEAARPLYDISDSQHIPLVRELQELFQRPSARDALQIAGRQLKDRGENIREHGLIEDRDGVFSLGPAPRMPLYDRAKTILDQTVYEGSRPFAAPEVTRAKDGALSIRNRLLEIMDGDGSGPRYPSASTDIAPASASPSAHTAPQVSPMQPQQGSLHAPANGGAALPSPPPNLLGHGPHDPTLADIGIPDVRRGVPVTYAPPSGGVPSVPGAGPVPGVPSVPGAGPVPAVPGGDPSFAPFNYGQRLHPEGPEPTSPGKRRRTSSIPPEGLNPYWKPARDAYAGPVRNREALELGSEMAKKDVDEAANRMAAMGSQSQRDFFRLGHRTGLSKDVSGMGDYANAARRVDGNDKARKIISYVHGQERADNLFDRLAAEHEGHQTWAAVRGNSMTAGREAEDEISRQEQALADTGKGLWAAAQGRGIDALRHFSSSFSGGPALTGKVNDITASKLGSMRLSDVRQTLADVSRVRSADAAFARVSDKANKTLAKTAGSRTGAAVSTPDSQVLLGYGQNADGSYYPLYGEPGTAPAGDYIPANL